MSAVGPRFGATCLRPEAVKWEEGFEPDQRDPRILGEGPCGQMHEAKPKYEQNQWGVWLICRTCAVRLHYAPKKAAPQNTISLGPTPEVVRAVIANLTPGDQIDYNRFRGMIKIEQGRRQAARAKARACASTPGEDRAPKTAPTSKGTGSTSKARPSRAPTYDLSSQAPQEEDENSPALDRWSILLRRLFRSQLEIEAMMEQDSEL